jgi:ribosomal protein S18 acetylase RimI-like enzyme
VSATDGPSVEVTVRRARQGDVPRLAAWNAQLIHDERNDQGVPDHEIEPRLREWLAKDYVACVFEVGGSVPTGRPEGLTAPPRGAASEANVGAIIPFGYAIFRDLPDCVHLRHFFVESAFRRRGFGRRAFTLLRAMFPRGKRVLVEVLVGNAPAAAFWRSVGFEDRYLGLQLTPGE